MHSGDLYDVQEGKLKMSRSNSSLAIKKVTSLRQIEHKGFRCDELQGLLLSTISSAVADLRTQTLVSRSRNHQFYNFGKASLA